MTKPRRSKVYKDAVKKMTATVDAMNSGAWQPAVVPQTVVTPNTPARPPKAPLAGVSQRGVPFPSRTPGGRKR